MTRKQQVRTLNQYGYLSVMVGNNPTNFFKARLSKGRLELHSRSMKTWLEMPAGTEIFDFNGAVILTVAAE